MPRVLTLRQGHIYSAPVEEMRELRVADSEREIAAADIVDYELPLSDGAEILLNLRFGQAAKIAVSLVYGQEKLVFAYDRIKQTMVIDRTDMKLGGRGKRRFKLFAEDTLNMRFFVDRTAVEGFFQYGEQAASLLVFPEKYIMPELTVHADLPLEAMDGTVWKMAACQWDACS
jgi:beta-fructofuranosidase